MFTLFPPHRILNLIPWDCWSISWGCCFNFLGVELLFLWLRFRSTLRRKISKVTITSFHLTILARRVSAGRVLAGLGGSWRLSRKISKKLTIISFHLTILVQWQNARSHVSLAFNRWCVKCQTYTKASRQIMLYSYIKPGCFNQWKGQLSKRQHVYSLWLD